MDDVGWYGDNSGSKTHPVGQKKPNGFGLYDMSGNVYEWVWDSAVLDSNNRFTGASTYFSSSQTDPHVDASSPYRKDRGGSWYTDARNTRVSDRGKSYASSRFNVLGFRILRTIP